MGKHRYVLGKVDYNRNGHRNCEAAITWELRRDGDGFEFSMCAEIWMPSKRDMFCGGQCVDTVAAYFPHDAKAQRMVEVWKRWHLNHMRAGSPAQEAYLREHPMDPASYAYPKSYYEAAQAHLRAAGLNPDRNYLHNGKPYYYGHAWIREELPDSVRAEIESWGRAE